MATDFCRTEPGAWIRVNGEDAWGFLQSQFSNDLRTGGSRCVTYGLWLDRRGRVEADSFVFQGADGGIFLCSYFSDAEMILGKLERNVVADDVEFEDLTAGCSLFSLWGESSVEFLSGFDCSPPVEGEYADFSQGRVWRGRRSSGENFDIFASKEDEKWLERKVVRHLDEHGGNWVSVEEMHAERIRSHIPWVPVDIGPGDLPQEGHLGGSAVSYEKGCYLGQEVMSRIHSIGRVQRKLCLVEGEMTSYTDSLPHEVYADGIAAGQLRSVAPMEDRWRGHALLKRRLLESGTVFSLDPSRKRILGVIEGI